MNNILLPIMSRHRALSMTTIWILELRLGALNNSLVKPFLEVQGDLLQLLEAWILRELTSFLEIRLLEVSYKIGMLIRFPRVLPAISQQVILQLVENSYKRALSRKKQQFWYDRRALDRLIFVSR